MGKGGCLKIPIDIKELEKKALQLLSDLGLNIKGYYSYGSITDIVGYFKPQEPLTSMTKFMLEVRTDQLNRENIEGLLKLSGNTLAEKSILCATEEFENLPSDLQELISKSSIEYFGVDTIDRILEEKGRSSADVANLTSACEFFSAKKLAEILPHLAKQIVPVEVKRALPTREAWEILEDAVFGVFNFCLGYTTIQLGRKTLFQNEPEGKVICAGKKGGHFGLIYDCKSSQSSYKMTKQDELTYVDYIQMKKIEFDKLHNCELQYFLIISPRFSGNLEKRRDAVFKQTGVLLFFIEAKTLKKIALWAFDLPNNIKALIDFSDFLLTSELVVTEKTVAENIDRINKYR